MGGVNLAKRSCNSQAGSLCLASKASTFYINTDIIFIFLTYYAKRLHNGFFEGFRREIRLNSAFINSDVTFTSDHAYAGDGGFSSSCSSNCSLHALLKLG